VQKIDGRGGTMTLTDKKTYVDTSVDLADLLDAEAPPVLDGFTFRRCKINGPMVLWLDPTARIHLEACGFNAPDLESILWASRSEVAFIGVTMVRNCAFIECELDRVGFGGSPAQITDLRQILCA
jgi:hypothetical protein